jgi:hypothetical protein
MLKRELSHSASVDLPQLMGPESKTIFSIIVSPALNDIQDTTRKASREFAYGAMELMWEDHRQ